MSGHSLGTIEFGSGNIAGYGTDQPQIGANSMFEDFHRDLAGNPIGLGDLTPDIIDGIHQRAHARRVIAGSWINPDYQDLIKRQQVVQAQAVSTAEEPINAAVDPRAHITDAYTPQAQGLGNVTVAELAEQVRQSWSVVQKHADHMAARRVRKQELGIPFVGRVASKHRLINPPRIQGYDSWDDFLTATPLPELDMQHTMPFHPFLDDPDILSAQESLRRAREKMNAETIQFFFPETAHEGDVHSDQLESFASQVGEVPVMGSPIVVSVAPDSEYIGVPRELVDSSLAITIPMQRIQSDSQTGPYAVQAEYTTDSLPVVTNDGEIPEAVDPAVGEYEVDISAEDYEGYLPAADAIEEDILEKPELKVGFFRRLGRRLFGGRRAAKTALQEVVLVETEEPHTDTPHEGSGTPVQGIDPDTITTAPLSIPDSYIGQEGMQFGGNETVLPLLAEAGQSLEDEDNTQHH